MFSLFDFIIFIPLFPTSSNIIILSGVTSGAWPSSAVHTASAVVLWETDTLVEARNLF
ncbi:hypothetical protein HanRHA438_Chr15g0711691 [Helianthus annuus]|nr:hypothetical protein HanIR_Chr15g0760561 [Helianthus annuus]KAJ0845266.1 hypothetical protein HanRHA438_Chr15g0711691 [Helianthus annuus]